MSLATRATRAFAACPVTSLAKGGNALVGTRGGFGRVRVGCGLREMRCGAQSAVLGPAPIANLDCPDAAVQVRRTGLP